MNNKGQTLFYGFMITVTIIVLALALAPAIKETTDGVRNETYMDCGNTSISDFDKAACVSTDLSSVYFIGGLITLAGAVALGKWIFA